jgi:hypothetical protein
VKSIVKKKGEWRLDRLQKWMHASSASSPPPSQELQPWCEVVTMSEQGLCSAIKLFPPRPLSLSLFLIITNNAASFLLVFCDTGPSSSFSSLFAAPPIRSSSWKWMSVLCFVSVSRVWYFSSLRGSL